VTRILPALAFLPLLAAQPARFAEHTIATGLRGGYQVVVADLNHDGKPDLIALASGMPDLVWYENPTWERHVIASGLNRMINCVAVAVEGDPIPEIVLASGFSNNAKDSPGIVSVLHHNGDPRQPWTMREIDRLPTSHRLRLAKIDGGKPVVVNAALTGPEAEPPDYRGRTPLVFYRPGEWKRHLISDENSGVVHGILITDWDGDGRDEILTASFGGIHLFRLGQDGRWTRTEIARGDPAPWPKSGSSDIALGRLGGARFLAAIEPWHGNQVAIYSERNKTWERSVIDDSLVDGHTILTADLNGDGADEVIAGYRGQGRSVYTYYAAGDHWTRVPLDSGGMGAAACAVADLNGDRRPDVACIGSATANLKWYENLGVEADAQPAARPPMGWNSWDAYGTTVTEAEVKANADFMARKLKQYGWQYVVVDIQWSERNPRAHGYRPDAELAMDGYGRLIPAENRFPSAAGGRGFKPLADYVHGLGLKFGIHIMRGIPRRAVGANLPVDGSTARAGEIADVHSVCPWNTDMYGVDMSRPGGQDYYDSLLKLYADWGVDYIKADDIARPVHRDEIAALHRAIGKTGRSIVLSLSPGPATLKDLPFLQENANMWRISDDFWDDWQSLKQMFLLLSVWGGAGRPGAWPDADMLPLGHIGLRAERGDARTSRFTHDEAQTVMSLWSIAQSPLMFGGDLPTSDDFTLSLIGNDEVLAVDQKGAHGYPFWQSGAQVAWAADGADGNEKYLGVFNTGERPGTIRVDWGALKLPDSCTLRDLWAKKELGTMAAGYTFQLPPHGSGLYRVSAAR